MLGCLLLYGIIKALIDILSYKELELNYPGLIYSVDL